MKYKELFSIKISHSYFHTGSTPHLKLIPDFETEKLLKNHKIILKSNDIGVQLMYAATADDEFILPLKNLTSFRFYLQMQNSNILSITKWNNRNLDRFLKGLGYNYYYNGDEEVLEENFNEFLEIEKFFVKDSSDKEYFFIKGNPIQSLSEADFSISGLEGISEPNEYHADYKRITIDTSQANIGKSFQVTYRSTTQWASNILGLVEIQYKERFSFGIEYKLQLDARIADWQYYLVTDEPEVSPEGNGETDENEEIDTGEENNQSETNDSTNGYAIEDIEGSGTPEMIFNQINILETDLVYRKLITVYPQAHFLRFTLKNDQDKHIYQERGRTGITLKKEGEILRSNLSNPSPFDNGISIINLLTN